MAVASLIRRVYNSTQKSRFSIYLGFEVQGSVCFQHSLGERNKINFSCLLNSGLLNKV